MILNYWSGSAGVVARFYRRSTLNLELIVFRSANKISGGSLLSYLFIRIYMSFRLSLPCSTSCDGHHSPLGGPSARLPNVAIEKKFIKIE